MRAFHLIGFFFYYLREFLKANIILIKDIFRRKSKACPAIIKIDLQSKSHLEITTIASLITLTPGSMTLSIKADPPALFVHGVFVENIEEFKKDINKLEDKMLKLFQPAKQQRETR